MSDDFSPPDLDDYEEFVERRFDGVLTRLELVEEELVVLERLVAQLEELAEEDPTSGAGFIPPDSDAVDRANDSLAEIAAAVERLDRSDDRAEDVTDGAGIENVDEDEVDRRKGIDGGDGDARGDEADDGAE